MKKKGNGKSNRAFIDYFNLGERRSLEVLYQKYSKDDPSPPTRSLSTLKYWSRRDKWVEQIGAMEGEAQQKWTDKTIDEIAEMKQRQAKEGKELQELGSKVISYYLKIIKEVGEGASFRVVADKINPYVARSLIIDGAKLESLALGEPSEIKREQVEMEADIEISESEEELHWIAEQINELRNKCKKISKDS